MAICIYWFSRQHLHQILQSNWMSAVFGGYWFLGFSWRCVLDWCWMKYMPNNWGLNYEQEGELMQELSWNSSYLCVKVICAFFQGYLLVALFFGCKALLWLNYFGRYGIYIWLRLISLIFGYVWIMVSSCCEGDIELCLDLYLCGFIGYFFGISLFRYKLELWLN